MTIQRKRLPTDERHRQILTAALKVAEKKGIHIMTMDEVAKEAKCSRPLVVRFLGNSEKFRKEIIAEAIRLKHLRLIGQGILLKDRQCTRLSSDIKAAALAALNA